MAHLDLHEQEQLSNLKHFWRLYGKYIISIFVIAIMGYLVNVLWNWNSSTNAAKAAVMYSEFTSAASQGEKEKATKLVSQLQSEYPKTEYATMASFLTASTAFKNNDFTTATKMLSWSIDNSKDKGLIDIARLRLANIYIDQKKFDKAMSLLLEKHDAAFDPLYYTARGDLYVAKGDINKARDAYKEALQKAGQDSGAAQGVQMRLDILGNN